MSRTLIVLIVLKFFCGSTMVAAEDRLVFSDEFPGEKISADWEIHDGNWFVKDGALVNQDGGLISLKSPPGGRFRLEFEIAFPANWMSVIPFLTKPDNYGTLYFTNGYWESFEIKGDSLANYVQRREARIVTGNGSHSLKITSDFGLITVDFDGQRQGVATLPYRPGARIAFRSLPGAGQLKIQHVRVSRLDAGNLRSVAEVSVDALAQCVVRADENFAERKDIQERLTVDRKAGSAPLNYQFTDDDVFQSRWARLPVEAAECSRLLLDLAGDNSGNTVFVIVHDASGEQHLVMKSALAWEGWEEVGINLEPFLTSPPKLERHNIHWGGDGNQRIDFPITAIDLGVSKRGERMRSAGAIEFRKIRFADEAK